MLESSLWLPLAAALAPAALLTLMAMQKGVARALGLGAALSLAFPAALLLHLAGPPAWFSSLLLGLLAGFCLWPGMPALRGPAALVAGLAWLSVGLVLASSPAWLRAGALGLALVIVCAPCYDKNWVTGMLGLAFPAVAALLLGPAMDVAASRTGREVVLVPVLVALVFYMDPASRRWRLPPRP
jgi:hypothetical protein